MSDSGKAVFLSYASQDAEAARKICDALRAAGVEVWFDQSELRGGDSWDAKIRKQIKECALFVPVISANTQSRHEGYFRLEWHLAEQRSHLIARGRPFIVPVCVDDTRDADALVPEAFLAVQWMRVSRGEATATFCERVKVLLGGSEKEAGRSRPAQRDEGVAPPAKTARGPRWVKPVLASAVVVAIVLAGALLRRPNREGSQKPVAASSAPSIAGEQLSPARELTRRARQILDQGSLTRAQLDAAGELCDRALQLDATDALVWATAADVELRYVYPYGYDRSDERRRRAQERAARATSLGPGLFEVRLIQAEVFAHAVGTPALLAEAEKTIRALRAARPDDPELVRQLAEVLRERKRFDEAAQLFESIGEFEVAGWSYFQADEARPALAALGRAPRSVTALQLKAILEYSANEDLDAAQAVVGQFQPSELLAEMPASVAIRVAIYRRDPQRVLELAQGLAKDFLDSNAFRGPRGYFTGLAYEMAGRPAQAESEWRAALAVVEAQLSAAPDDRELLGWSAWLHAALHDTAGAERIDARSQALAGLSGDTLDLSDGQASLINLHVLLRLHRTEALLAGLKKVFRAKAWNWESVHAELRFGPEADFLRGEPRFEKLLRDNLPRGAKPFGDQVSAISDQRSAASPTPSSPFPVDGKSVAVLAFANLSDDKGNEYFSDGISEELLTVLQKIPGLHVAARTSSFSFKGKDATAQEIGRTLGVADLVDGSVQKSGNRVKVIVRLSRAATGEELWSDSYTRELKDVFALEDELATAIVGELSGHLGGAGKATDMKVAVKGGTTNPAAYERYLQGRYFLNQFSIENMTKAIGCFERATSLDPNFALAWAALARTHALNAGWSDRLTRQEFEGELALARRAADRALALEPDSPEALNARFEIQFNYDFDWKGAADTARQALALAPSDPVLLAAASRVAGIFGQRERAVELARQAVALDPVNPEIRVYLAMALLHSHQWFAARAEFARIAELNPTTPLAYAGVGLADLYEGKYAEAIAAAKPEALGLARMLVLAIGLRGEHKPAEADAALQQLIKDGADLAAYQIAEIYGFRGEKDEAFAWLDRARRQRDSGLATFTDDPFLDSLHSDPRWEAFEKSMGLTKDQLK